MTAKRTLHNHTINRPRRLGSLSHGSRWALRKASRAGGRERSALAEAGGVSSVRFDLHFAQACGGRQEANAQSASTTSEVAALRASSEICGGVPEECALHTWSQAEPADSSLLRVSMKSVSALLNMRQCSQSHPCLHDALASACPAAALVAAPTVTPSASNACAGISEAQSADPTRTSGNPARPTGSRRPSCRGRPSARCGTSRQSCGRTERRGRRAHESFTRREQHGNTHGSTSRHACCVRAPDVGW